MTQEAKKENSARVQIGPPRREQGLVTGTRIGNLVFLSALRGRGDTIQEQAKVALDQMKELLEEAGSDLDHVAMVTVYFQDIGERTRFDEVWVQYFSDNAPARTGIEVANASPSPGGTSRFAFDVIAVTK
jgi:enamine deaminase RidA (YjgF/YER057c/UK114 family)